MINSDKDSPDFNSYACVSDLKNYAESRYIDITDDNALLESMLLKGMDYLETRRWLGKRSDSKQLLSFPRLGLEQDGIPVPCGVIPNQLIIAQCRLAIESKESDLQPTLGGEVISERVDGAVTVQYAQGTNTGAPNFVWLKPLLYGLMDISDDFAINTFSRR